MVIEIEGGDDDLPPETMPEDLPAPSLEEKASVSEPSDVPSEGTSLPNPETTEEVSSVEPSEEKASASPPETIPKGSSVQLPEQIPTQQPATFTGDLSFLGPAYGSVPPPPAESGQGKKKKGGKGKKSSVAKPKEKKEKGPKKKRLSKKERARLAAEQAEQERLERERERNRLIQEEKQGIKDDCQAAEEMKRHDAEEQESRLAQLQTTFEFIKHYESRMFEIKLENRIQEEWKRYLKCDGLPDPASVQQMHIYLHMWQIDDRLNDIDHVLAKSDEVIRFTEVLDELIENPLDNSERKVELWKEIRNSIRTTLQQHLDTATYILLRCVERNLTFITDEEVFYERITPHFILCLWGILPPPPTYSPEEQPKKVKTCSFDQLGITVQTPESVGEVDFILKELHLMPESLADVDFILRALHLKYDHYSDRCPSWPTPALPETYSQDLIDVVQAEWEAKKILQISVDEEFDQRIKRRQTIIAQYAASARPATAASGYEKRAEKGSKSAGNAPEPEPDYPALLQEMHDLPPIKTALERYCEEEDEVANLLKVDLLYSCNDDELNLRKFRILNGVLFVDMLRQLPQPRELRKGHVITLLTLPQELESVDFHIKYTPPPPPEPGQRRLPEEIEAELKKQEEQLERLILVNITLPETVLWFEPPITVLWDEDKGYWSTAECHDFKFNEDKQILTFRLGRPGLLGLAAYRYCNFPFQTWEIKPDFKEDKVVFSITAAIVSVEFTFKEEKVCLSLLQNGATNALQDIVGVYYDPHVLAKKMRLGGVDLFPESDTPCYVEGAHPKHHSAENHLYHCMAMFCLSHNFTWSRWNLQAGRRNMVLRMREYLDRKRLPSQNTVHVTPLKATVVDCSEMSPCFDPTSLPGMKFYADLYHLIQDNFTIVAKNKSSDTSFKLIESIYEMLKITRVLSYS